MCVGCRRRAAPDELVRIVRSADGELQLGMPGRSGRGAWVCSVDCLDSAGHRGLSRALRAEVTPADVDALRARLAGRGRIEIRHRRAPRDGMSQERM